MAPSMRSIILALLVLPAASLVARPFTGCKKAFLQRGDPADSKTIEGDDCGNVNQIVGKWAKSKKVGQLAGQAQAAVMSANLAAKNTDAAVEQANALGKKAGLKDDIPEGVKLAAESADKASKAAAKAAGTLKTTATTFSGKFGDFAKAISDDDIIQIKKETEAAVVAAEDATEAAERALATAEKAKAEAMKSSAGALKLIDGTIADTTALAKEVGEVSQKSSHVAQDVGDLIKKSKAAAGKVDDKMKDAKEQKPVWEAYKADLEGREKAAGDSQKAVTDAIADLKDAAGDMGTSQKMLQVVKDKSLAAPNVLLGQSKNLDAAEESIRKTESALKVLKMKVQSMMKDGERLASKITETSKRLGN